MKVEDLMSFQLVDLTRWEHGEEKRADVLIFFWFYAMWLILFCVCYVAVGGWG